MMYETFQAFYAIVKHALGIPRGSNVRPSFRPFLVIASFLVMLLFALFFAVWWLAYSAVHVYLRCKEGRRFAGMLTGIDPVWEGIRLHILVTVKASESRGEFAAKMRSLAQKLRDSCDKLNYLTRSCLGYRYYVKGSLDLNDFITEMEHEGESVLTEETLVKYIADNLMKPGVLKGRTWRMSTFKQSVRWPDGTCKYACVLTFNHCVGDGIALMALMKHRVCEGFEFLDPYKCGSTRTTKSLDDAYIFSQKDYRELKKREEGPSDHLVTLFIEDEPKFVPMIRELKTKLGASFNQILISGFIVAYTEYVAKKNIHFPNLRIGYTLRYPAAKTAAMIEGNYNYNKIRNELLVTSMNLYGEATKDMLQTVLKLHQTGQELISSSNISLMGIVGSIMHLLPIPLSGAIYDKVLFGGNVGLTNIAGIVSLEMGGYRMEDIAFFLYPAHFSDVVLCALSHGGRLSISATAATGIVESKEDLDAIVRRAFEHIELLHSEFKSNDRVAGVVES